MIRILFVDDEPEIHSITKQYLEVHPDFLVDTVDSAKNALIFLQTNSYNAIIAEYGMPDIEGVAHLRKVRSTHPHIPFIFFIGHGKEEVAIGALNNGADFYLQKGVNPSDQYADLAKKNSICRLPKKIRDRSFQKE